MNIPVPATRKALSQAAAFALVLALWLVYASLQILMVMDKLPEAWLAPLGFLPGLLGVAALLAAGLRREQLFLRFAPLSRAGFAVLASILVLGLAVVIPFGVWQGVNVRAALIYAPASGVAQELFFRAALLPACLLALPGRPRLALFLHALLFSLWHAGPFFVGAPLWASLAVMGVPLVCGLGWGWQVQRDRTVLWAMLQHSLIWMIAGQFPMPA